MSKIYTERKNRQVKVDKFHLRIPTSHNCTYSRYCPSSKIGNDEGRNSKKQTNKSIYATDK